MCMDKVCDGDQLVEVRGAELRVPDSLCAHLGSKGFFIELSRESWIRRKTFGSWFKRLTESLRSCDMVTPRFLESSCGTSLFQVSRAVLPDGKYQLVNYDSKVLLLPVDGLVEPDSRQLFWSNISDYHEHRRVGKQQDNACAVSKWLASTFSQHKPSSILELGCGSGRNLHFIDQQCSGVRLTGVEINPAAVESGQRNLRQAQNEVALLEGSLYELGSFSDGQFDLVFTSGVLMHIPHDRVGAVVREMQRIASRAVFHFELDGPEFDFDYHRYPRDYSELYAKLGFSHVYEVFKRGDFRSKGTRSFQHALLTSVKG